VSYEDASEGGSRFVVRVPLAKRTEKPASETPAAAPTH